MKFEKRKNVSSLVYQSMAISKKMLPNHRCMQWMETPEIQLKRGGKLCSDGTGSIKLMLDLGDHYHLTDKALCTLSVLSGVQSLAAAFSWLSFRSICLKIQGITVVTCSPTISLMTTCLTLLYKSTTYNVHYSCIIRRIALWHFAYMID